MTEKQKNLMKSLSKLTVRPSSIDINFLSNWLQYKMKLHCKFACLKNCVKVPCCMCRPVSRTNCFFLPLIIGLGLICARQFYENLKPLSAEQLQSSLEMPSSSVLQSSLQAQSSSLRLDDLLNQKVPNSSIFFLETSAILRKKLGWISKRRACSVESAARMNPNSTVFLIFVDVDELQPLITIDELKIYKNIRVVGLNMTNIGDGSPLEDFVRQKKILKSSYPLAHASDLLRFLILWK